MRDEIEERRIPISTYLKEIRHADDLERQLAEAKAARDVAELDLHTLQDAFALVMQERNAANAALAESQADVMELGEDGKALSDSHHKQHEELVAIRAALAEAEARANALFLGKVEGRCVKHLTEPYPEGCTVCTAAALADAVQGLRAFANPLWEYTDEDRRAAAMQTLARIDPRPEETPV